MCANPFMSPDYWHAKGHKMQTGKSSNENLNQHLKSKNKYGIKQKIRVADNSEQALDYYYQGIRIDGCHFGCTFNIAIVFLNRGMIVNARKWFKLAKRLNPNSIETFLGLAITALKLGEHQNCIQCIKNRPGQKSKKELSKAKDRRNSMGPLSQKSSTQNIDSTRSPRIEPKPQEDELKTKNTQEDDILHQTPARVEFKNGEGESPQKGETGEKETKFGAEKAPMIQFTDLSIEDQFTFLLAICHKKNLEFDQCQKHYSQLENTFQSRQGFRLAKCVFTNLMLPLQINRKLVEQYVTQFCIWE